MYITNENADKIVSMMNTEMSRMLDRGELSKETVCLIGEMVDILKDVHELDKGEMPMEEGYSQGMRSYRGSYDDGYSYARDRMGRYTSHDNMRSMGRSYGTERDHLMNKMNQFMDQASSESERELVRRIMREI